MPDLKILPISQVEHQSLFLLMGDEVQAWIAELGWDYSSVSAILGACVSQNILPGYAALTSGGLSGYGYFLVHQDKGIVGTIYAPRTDVQQEAADGILTSCVRSLRDSIRVRRIEAQIMPFHNISLTTGFIRHGFQFFPRYFLELDLAGYVPSADARHSSTKVIRWDTARLAEGANVVEQSYRNEADAQICEDYCSVPGCESYLRSLIENPGCGSFLPDASFMGIDSEGAACGFIVSSRIAPNSGMIPQIAIHPQHQGKGLGDQLMRKALSCMQAAGMRTVGLTVTKKNRRAFEWYQRLGFRIRKEFGAFVWERT